MGVRQHTAIEEYHLYLPSAVKSLAARTLRISGKQLFCLDHADFRQTLFYQLATSPDSLAPLRAFRTLRLYANVNLDFVVPLGTGAFLSDEEVKQVRQRYRRHYGIVETVPPPVPSSSGVSTTSELMLDVSGDEGEVINDAPVPSAQSSPSPALSSKSTKSSSSKQKDKDNIQQALAEMRTSLNALHWEKVFVHFRGVIPLAHNKIAALTKSSAFFDSLLGFPEGRFVMDHAFTYLSQPLEDSSANEQQGGGARDLTQDESAAERKEQEVTVTGV